MLVTIVVFSVGVLAVAALQLVSRHGVMEAAHRTIAARLAQDVLERMRANNLPEALARYVALASPWPARWAGRQNLAATLAGPGCAGTGACAGPSASARDLYDWEQSLDGHAEKAARQPVGGLPHPTACIVGPATGASGTYTVTIAWRGRIALPDDAGTECGRAAATPEGTPLYGDHDQYRRHLTITAFIAARA